MGQRRKQVELPVYNLIGTSPLTHPGGVSECRGLSVLVSLHPVRVRTELGALKALHSRWRCGACEAEKGAEVQDGTLHGNC